MDLLTESLAAHAAVVAAARKLGPARDDDDDDDDATAAVAAEHALHLLHVARSSGLPAATAAALDRIIEDAERATERLRALAVFKAREREFAAVLERAAEQRMDALEERVHSMGVMCAKLSASTDEVLKSGADVGLRMDVLEHACAAHDAVVERAEKSIVAALRKV